MDKTIMVVDSEQPFHNLYKAILKDSGCKIISVYDGFEALTRLEQTKPDLIIIDIVLDMMTGDTLFLHIKSMPEYKDIPIIIASDISLRPYKGLKKIDPNLIFLNKMFAWKKMMKEVKAKIG